MLNYYETRYIVIMNGEVISDRINYIIREEENAPVEYETKNIGWDELNKMYEENHKNFSFYMTKPHLWWRICFEDRCFINELENLDSNFTLVKTAKKTVPTLSEILSSSDENAFKFLLEHGNIELK